MLLPCYGTGEESCTCAARLGAPARGVPEERFVSEGDKPLLEMYAESTGPMEISESLKSPGWLTNVTLHKYPPAQPAPTAGVATGADTVTVSPSC